MLVLLVQTVVLGHLVPVVGQVVQEAVHVVELLLPEQDAVTDSLGLHEQGDLGRLGTAGDVPPQLVATLLLSVHTLGEGTQVGLQLGGHPVGQALVVVVLLKGGEEVGLKAPDVDRILDVGEVIHLGFSIPNVVDVLGSHHLVAGEMLLEHGAVLVDEIQVLLVQRLIHHVEVGLIQPLLLLGQECVGRLNAAYGHLLLPTDGVEGGHTGIVQILYNTAVGEVSLGIVGQSVGTDAVGQHEVIVVLIQQTVVALPALMGNVDVVPGEIHLGLAGGLLGQDKVPDVGAHSSLLDLVAVGIGDRNGSGVLTGGGIHKGGCLDDVHVTAAGLQVKGLTVLDPRNGIHEGLPFHVVEVVAIHQLGFQLGTVCVLEGGHRNGKTTMAVLGGEEHVGALGLVLGQAKEVGVPAGGGDILGRVIDVGVIEPKVKVCILCGGVLLIIVQGGSLIGGGQQLLYLLLHLGIGYNLKGVLDTLLGDGAHFLHVLGKPDGRDIHGLPCPGGTELVVKAEAVDLARPSIGIGHIENNVLPIIRSVIEGGLQDTVTGSTADRAGTIEQLKLGGGALLGLDTEDDVLIILCQKLLTADDAAIIIIVEKHLRVGRYAGGGNLHNVAFVLQFLTGNLDSDGALELLFYALMIQANAGRIGLGCLGLGSGCGLGRDDLVGIDHRGFFNGSGCVDRIRGIGLGFGAGIRHNGRCLSLRGITAGRYERTSHQNGEDGQQNQKQRKILFHRILLFSSFSLHENGYMIIIA